MRPTQRRRQGLWDGQRRLRSRAGSSPLNWKSAWNPRFLPAIYVFLMCCCLVSGLASAIPLTANRVPDYSPSAVTISAPPPSPPPPSSPSTTPSSNSSSTTNVSLPDDAIPVSSDTDSSAACACPLSPLQSPSPPLAVINQTPPGTIPRITAPWADLVIGFSYFAIPIELAFFVYRLPSTTIYQRCVGGLFVCFILLCGLGHFLDAAHAAPEWVLADRYATAFISAVTAIASPIVLSYSVDAVKRFSEESKLVEKQRDMLADAQAMTHLGNWELQADKETGLQWWRASDELFRILGMPYGSYENNTIPFSRYIVCVAEEDRAAFIEANDDALTNGEQYNIIQRIYRESDRREVYIRIFGKPVIEDGRITGLRGTAQDISMQISGERELTRAKEAALIESKHKDIFLATMSHELRTPLTSIAGHVELMEETNLDVIQREYMSNAKRSTATLLSQINDILDYSKLIAGMVELDLHVANISEILSDVHVISNNLSKDVTLQIDPYSGPNVIADSVRLKQVLLNLVSNAVKFTLAGGFVHVTNSWTLDSADNVNLTVAVKDSGIGIAPDVIQRLFTPFTQADAATNRRFGGTGLGLSIVKKLVTAMAGSIQVDSVENVGSTFKVKFRMPRAHVQVEVIPPPVVADSLIRVLVAEDNSITQELIRRMLKGYEVDVAENGQIAVDKIQANDAYNILFCDLNMPVMDGLMAVKQIRTLPKGQSIYIVGLTANAFKSDRENCIKAGMDDYLSKPFTKKALLEMIGKIQKKKS